MFVSSRLTALVPELVTEVLLWLPWEDLLHMRMVCKQLSEATRTHAIWAPLVDGYILAHPQPPNLDRPIAMYTSSELERLFLLWKSAEVGWETDDGQPVRERALSVETSDFVYLVKGGRWLLVATQAGAVKYYDLDAEVITGVALIPDQTFIAATAHSATLMSVDVDQDSPVLSFRLAFALCGFGPSASFQIWQINPMLDDSQRAIGLTATLLASLAQPPDIVIVLAISLLRNQLAFNGILLANNEMFAFVMDWRQGNGTTSTYNRRMITTSMIILNDIHLMHGNKVLTSYASELTISDWSTAEETVPLPHPRYEPTSATFQCPILRDGGLSSNSWPRGHFNVITSELLFSAKESLYSMRFDNPFENALVPPLVKLADLHGITSRRSATGYTRAAAVTDLGDVWLIRYTRSSGSAESLALPSPVYKRLLSAYPGVSQTRNIVMDEHSGRVVLYGPPEISVATIVDFALVFKQ